MNTVVNARDYWQNNNLDSYDFVMLLPRKNDKIRSAFTRKLGKHSGIVIDGEAALALLELYSLYEFTDSIIVGSFDEPYGRKLHNLINCGIATEDELINDVILSAL